MKLSAVGMYRTGMLLRVLKLAMFCAIATHISAREYETRAPEGRVANPNPDRESADEAEIREKSSFVEPRTKSSKEKRDFKLVGHRKTTERRRRKVRFIFFTKKILTLLLRKLL